LIFPLEKISMLKTYFLLPQNRVPSLYFLLKYCFVFFFVFNVYKELCVVQYKTYCLLIFKV
jgi:hypothetical protein